MILEYDRQRWDLDVKPAVTTLNGNHTNYSYYSIHITYCVFGNNYNIYCAMKTNIITSLNRMRYRLIAVNSTTQN